MSTATRSSVRGTLMAALTAGLAALETGPEMPRGREQAFLGELMDELTRPNRVRTAPSTAASVASWMVELAGEDAERRATLADVAALIARQLAPVDDHRAVVAIGQVWHGLLSAIERLGAGSGARRLERPTFLTAALLAALRAEATAALAGRQVGCGQWGAQAGPILTRLAVSRQLRQTVSTTLKVMATPTYSAVYLADPEGSVVQPHIDKRGWDLVVHIVLDHDVPPDAPGSVLLVHRAGLQEPRHLRLLPGQGVVLWARSTLHEWTPLNLGEQRRMVAIGFVPEERVVADQHLLTSAGRATSRSASTATLA